MTPVRVVIRRGSERRVLVLELPPVPKQGDMLTVDGLDYTVKSVEPTEIIARIPRG